MWSTEQFADIVDLAVRRWPSALPASDLEVWAEWRRSLEPRFEYGDVMAALVTLSESREAYPPLARLMVACQERRDERVRAATPSLPPAPLVLEEPKPDNVARWLDAFDAGIARERARRHEELNEWASHRRGGVPDLAARHAAIDEIGENERRARELLASGLAPPGKLAQEVWYALGNAEGRRSGPVPVFEPVPAEPSDADVARLLEPVL